MLVMHVGLWGWALGHGLTDHCKLRLRLLADVPYSADAEGSMVVTHVKILTHKYRAPGLLTT